MKKSMQTKKQPPSSKVNASKQLKEQSGNRATLNPKNSNPLIQGIEVVQQSITDQSIRNKFTSKSPSKKSLQLQ